jgi:hypothetical protein
LGDLNSANRYVYANDDPVNATDPRGTNSTFGCILSLFLAAGNGLLDVAAATGLAIGFINFIIPLVVAGIVGLGFAIGIAIGIALFGVLVAIGGVVFAIAYCFGVV